MVLPNTCPSNLDIFKIVGAVGSENSFFMAFTEDEDEVAFFGFVDGELDGFFTVRFFEEVFAEGFAGFFGALGEACHNLV